MRRVLFLTVLLLIFLSGSIYAQPQDTRDRTNNTYLAIAQDWKMDTLVSKNQGKFDSRGPLMSFHGKDSAEGVVLDWSTVSRSPETRFLVERSWDGERYQVIGEVLDLVELHDENKFHFVDKYPRPGVNYYRLWLLDAENKEEISPSIWVSRKKL